MAVGENYQINPQYEGFIKEQLDAESICDKTAMLLRGYRWDPEQGKYTNIVRTVMFDDQKQEYIEVEYQVGPLLNEEGIQAVVGELRSRIANVFGSGSLSNNDIKTIRKSVAEVLWMKLRHNRRRYQLDLENFFSVLSIVDDQLLLFLSRTERGGFLRTLSRMIGRRENVNLQVAEQTKPGTLTKGGLFE